MNEILMDTLIGRIRDRAVLSAMRQLSRAAFLDDSLTARAEDDNALPIGFSQTTSQPFIIARMLEMMRQEKECETVLEIGCGCGYQTALLARLCKKVFAVERISQLAEKSRQTLRTMECHNVRIMHGDGLLGWPDNAPFDGIIICAEHDEVPPLLVQQLHPDGRLIMPLQCGNEVRLAAINADGKIIARRDAVCFVPLKKGTI